MVTAKDLHYRQLAPGQEYDFLPLVGKLIDTVPQLSGLECQLHAGEVSPRRSANFLDLARMRIDTVELDAAKLEGGESAKNTFIRAAWGNYFFPGDMNLVRGNKATLAYDALDKFLGNGSEKLSEGWKYQNGLLVSNPNIVVPQDWPTFTIDSMFNRFLSDAEAKEHRWWRAAFREQREVHHSYVDAAQAAATVMGFSLKEMMGVFANPISGTKAELRPWVLDRIDDGSSSNANNRRHLDDAGAQLVGVRK